MYRLQDLWDRRGGRSRTSSQLCFTYLRRWTNYVLISECYRCLLGYIATYVLTYILNLFKCQTQQPQFGLRWKIFELDGCDGTGRACLVFPPKAEGAAVDEIGNIHVEFIPPEPQVAPDLLQPLVPTFS